MTKATERADVRIAALALAVSFLSSGFAVYQWWTTGTDEKIRATIDISNKYIDEAIDPKAAIREYELMAGQVNTGYANRLDLEKLDPKLKIKKQYGRLEYISYLANQGKLDLRYLSQFVICDILTAPDDLTQTKQFRGARSDLTCPSMEKRQDDADEEDSTENKSDDKQKEPQAGQAPPKTGQAPPK